MADCFCGCCGREIACSIQSGDTDWCFDCFPHLDQIKRAPWDRTWFAQYGTPCPFEPSPDGGIEQIAA